MEKIRNDTIRTICEQWDNNASPERAKVRFRALVKAQFPMTRMFCPEISAELDDKNKTDDAEDTFIAEGQVIARDSKEGIHLPDAQLVFFECKLDCLIVCDTLLLFDCEMSDRTKITCNRMVHVSTEEKFSRSRNTDVKEDYHQICFGWNPKRAVYTNCVIGEIESDVPVVLVDSLVRTIYDGTSLQQPM
jgi:hypothetical protein